MKKKTFYIPIEDIPDQGLVVSYEDISPLWDGSEYQVEPFSRAEIKLVKTAENDVYMDGMMYISASFTCDRCLVLFKQDFDAVFSYVFKLKDIAKTQSYGADDDIEEAEADDDEGYPFDGVNIPVGDILMEQFELQLPMTMLCSPDCKGLCQSCGADLNKGHCSCKKETFSTTLAALKDIKITKK